MDWGLSFPGKYRSLNRMFKLGDRFVVETVAMGLHEKQECVGSCFGGRVFRYFLRETFVEGKIHHVLRIKVERSDGRSSPLSRSVTGAFIRSCLTVTR